MLVTLGSSVTIGAGATQTYQYACNSFQKLFISTEDGGGDALDAFITVQIGNEVICNDISARALCLLSGISGGAEYGANIARWVQNFGSHILDPQENVYVTLRNSDTANTITALDVAIEVNNAGTYQPIKMTNYADTVFTDTNTLAVYAWAQSSLKSEAGVMTIRNEAYSSSPQILSGTNVSLGRKQGFAEWDLIACMAENQVPMNTSVNYTASVGGVLCISAMDRMPSRQAEATRTGRNLVRSLTPSEAKAL